MSMCMYVHVYVWGVRGVYGLTLLISINLKASLPIYISGSTNFLEINQTRMIKTIVKDNINSKT